LFLIVEECVYLHQVKVTKIERGANHSLVVLRMRNRLKVSLTKNTMGNKKAVCFHKFNSL